MPVAPLALPAGECHVWWARAGAATLASAWLLDGDELARAERFRAGHDRLRYVAAHALARLVVGRYLAHHPATLRFAARCTTCGGSHGKPHLADQGSDLQLSISHSGDRVVIAVARGVAVGVDVEQVHGFAAEDALADAVLSPLERGVVEALPVAARTAALLRYWVRKEAVLKATGHGLAVSPASLTVSAPDQPARLLAWAPPSGLAVPVLLHDLAPGPAFVGCVALLTVVVHRVVEREGSALLTLGGDGGQRWPTMLGSPNKS
ncbi:MAG: 4'-phosphopantetheinyl transferase superfamily protein [Actinomycetota bacterium]|nr:4'-phosphopantetheinyl transferase superfamily protein [Actinomycetota bacterium]